MRKNNYNFKTSQTVLEYALTIGLTVVVLLGMQSYFIRSLEGRLKSSSDSIADEEFIDGTRTQGVSSMHKTTTGFSYEGGPYEGAYTRRDHSRRADITIYQR
jgi:hypothetical protein